jgi:RNA polymerase sigma factor (TIGR02999 family)
VTELLLAWGDGDAAALDALIPLVYDELRRIADRAMRREAVGHTLQPTGLVAEAYLRLVDQRHARWHNRAQFYGVATQVMRRVLVDHARARLAGKRGGAERQQVSLTDADGADGAPAGAAWVDVIALHEALIRLAALASQQARVVELRYFGGLTIEETAEAMEVSPATVKREWTVARAWLRRELAEAEGAE